MSSYRPCPLCGREVRVKRNFHKKGHGYPYITCQCGLEFDPVASEGEEYLQEKWDDRPMLDGAVGALEYYAKDYDYEKGCSVWDGGQRARQALSDLDVGPDDQ